MMAPFSPFVSDYIWRELTAGMDEAESVHLSDWPEAGKVEKKLLTDMAFAREVVAEGLARRAEAKIKVRQPLAKLTYYHENTLSDELNEIVREEVNVKKVVQVQEAEHEGLCNLYTNITPELKAEGMMRDIVRHIQSARRDASLEVDDRIVLTLSTNSKELSEAISAHKKGIMAETLAIELKNEGAEETVPVLVDAQELYIAVKKADS